MNQSHRGYYKVAYFTGIALVLITLGIEYFQYKRHEHLILSDLKNRLDEHTINVNLRSRAIQGYVNGLQMAAENSLIYIKEFNHTSFLFNLIKDSPDKKFFYLDIKDLKVNKDAVGNFSGVGSIESLSNDHKPEINMALFLNTYFEVALKNIRGGLRAYYISKNNFQLLYPWVALNPATLENLKKNISFQMAMAQQESYRHSFWTPAYKDRIVGSSVITKSSPIYDGKDFLGVISIDFSLVELNRVVNQFQSDSGALFLINKEHQVLATKGIDLNAPIHTLEEFLSPEMIQKINQEMQHPTNWFSLEGHSVVYVKDLHAAPWFLVYVDSKEKLFLDAFYDALQGIFIISLILIMVVGIGYLLVIRNFISPSEKLVKHIEKENKGLKSTPKNLPLRWQPWFKIVSRIFAENRALLEDLEHRVQDRTQELEQKNQELEQTLTALKKAKNQIIVQEKLASLGSLTAGIAHEIKNPLNFIINFTDLSLEYLHELKEKIPNESELFDLIEQNMTKSREHAEKADGIVKAMLAHARGSTGEITTFDCNDLLSQAIDLAYFGFQGQEHAFTVNITKDFDQNIGMVQGFAQELTRVFLNIVNNACFSMNEKRIALGQDYQPELKITTRDKGELIEIIFQDNGKGMNTTVLNKIFTPFFTTKGAGKGTGLGLSLSHDIIIRQHHGQLKAESKIGKYSRFIIELPKKM
jgi:signal transduction histidine kinase